MMQAHNRTNPLTSVIFHVMAFCISLGVTRGVSHMLFISQMILLLATSILTPNMCISSEMVIILTPKLEVSPHMKHYPFVNSIVISNVSNLLSNLH